MKPIIIILTTIFVGSIISSAGAVSYQYDALNRLTRVAYDNNNAFDYTYDANGNITGVTKFENGACGSAHGLSLAVAPTASLCASGSATAVTGTGPWYWVCAGQNGGSDANCSAAASNYTLSVTVTGSGSGTVTSYPQGTDPVGIACTSGTCSTKISADTAVELFYTADTNSFFEKWDGNCTGSDICKLTMDGIKNVTATFTIGQARVMIDGGATPYYAINTALDSILTQGKTIKARNMVFTENVIMAIPVTIILKGGYADTGFVSQPTGSYSTIDGSMKVRSGTLKVDRLKIK